MNDTPYPQNDLLFDALGALTQPRSPEVETLRQKVLAQTIDVLRRRRRVRQFAYAAALLLSFAAGALTMYLPGRGASKEDPLPVPIAKTQTPLPTTEDAANPTALDEEWIAFDSDEHRSERYRRAGDRYLTDENDPLSALRCYGNALDAGSEADLTISTSDNWLLMAIKSAREKEQSDAKKGG